MQTVWVIEEGEYSDYKVVGVYDSKEAAELILSSLRSHDATIDEWPVNPGVDELRKGLRRWHVTMQRDGTTERAEERELNSWSLGPNHSTIWERTKAPFYKDKNVPDALNADVWASSKEHAIKITNEIRTKMIATGEWK